MARLVIVCAAVLVVAIGVGIVTSSGPPARPAAGPAPANPTRAGAGTRGADQAFESAHSFLGRYELPDGRVVRWDQGGDTVSEGEAYAMLLSVAVGNRPRFDAAWSWTRAHLLQASGLLAWHWASGGVTGTEPASDADVDAAYALELGAGAFAEPADLAAATNLASAIARSETVALPAGRFLVAGPWAVGPPAYVNPSYGAPAELAALARLPAEGPTFRAMAAGSRALVSELLSAGSLPPDWVRLTAGAPLVASPSPTQSDPYGFDAVRLPIRWAASCDISDRRAVAGLWLKLGPAARRGRPTVDLAVHDGSGPQRRGVASPVGSVAAAAAGWAAGAHADALSLLARAETQNRAHPTYYSSAWVALGRVFLQTRRLGTCGA